MRSLPFPSVVLSVKVRSGIHAGLAFGLAATHFLVFSCVTTWIVGRAALK